MFVRDEEDEALGRALDGLHDDARSMRMPRSKRPKLVLTIDVSGSEDDEPVIDEPMDDMSLDDEADPLLDALVGDELDGEEPPFRDEDEDEDEF
jgi:hypothetical protein